MVLWAHLRSFEEVRPTSKLVGGNDYDWAEKWSAALNAVRDPEVRDKLLEYHSRTISLVMTGLVTGSPVLLVLAGIASLVFLAHRQWVGIRGAF